MLREEADTGVDECCLGAVVDGNLEWRFLARRGRAGIEVETEGSHVFSVNLQFIFGVLWFR